MAFTLQDPSSGLFWTAGIFGRIQLGPVPNIYTLEGSFIKNVNTGNYVNHIIDILHEGEEPEEFAFGTDGVISTQGKTVTAGAFLHVMDGEPTAWVKVAVEDEEEVPVKRASALIEEALNAKEECDCKCGEDCECEDCECADEKTL